LIRPRFETLPAGFWRDAAGLLIVSDFIAIYHRRNVLKANPGAFDWLPAIMAFGKALAARQSKRDVLAESIEDARIYPRAHFAFERGIF